MDSHDHISQPADELQYGGGRHYLHLQLGGFYFQEVLGQCSLETGAILYLGARGALVVQIGVNGEFEQCHRIGSNWLVLSVFRAALAQTNKWTGGPRPDHLLFVVLSLTRFTTWTLRQ